MCFQCFFFFSSKIFSFPSNSGLPVDLLRSGGGGRDKGDLFLRTQLSINDFLSFGTFWCLVAGPMSWRKEPCHPSLILCSELDHGYEYYLLSLLTFLVLLFPSYIIHVTVFRCIRSQVLEIWDNFKITDARPCCMSQHLQLVYEVKQNSCSGWLIFTRASPFPIRNRNACDFYILQFSMGIGVSSITYLTLLSYLTEHPELQLAMIKEASENMGN